MSKSDRLLARGNSNFFKHIMRQTGIIAHELYSPTHFSTLFQRTTAIARHPQDLAAA